MDKSRTDHPPPVSSQRARRLYRDELADPDHRRRPLRGCWAPDPSLTPDRLLRHIEEAEARPVQTIKVNRHARVLRADLLGRDVLLKRYDPASWLTRLKYLYRPSRARRAWAAARSLQALGIPTPEPLGYLDIRHNGFPVRNYIITQFMGDAVPVREWLKSWYMRVDEPVRASFRSALLDSLIHLYRNGVYHADTKVANLLVEHPEDEQRRTFYWIDLECVRFGVRYTRRMIVRNLAQLNASARFKIPEEDRLEFLRGAAAMFPWLTDPAIERWIRAWSRKRLLKEKRVRCGR